MTRWQTTTILDVEAAPDAIWDSAYAHAGDWPKWNRELKRATLNGPLREGAEARIVFRSGLRLRFVVTEFEHGRLFTDESRLPGARMGHRHLIEPRPDDRSRLTNTIYIDGPLAGLWRRVLGPAAARTLPEAQKTIAELVSKDRPSTVRLEPFGG